MKTKIYDSIIYIFFFIIISIYVIFIQDISRHWTSNFDMELMIAYNSILHMSGLKQEYLDHPTSIFFIIHSFFLKFLNIINLFDIKNLDQLNNKGRSINDDLNNLIFMTRFFNIFLSSFFVFIFYKILRQKVNFYISLIFTIIFLISATFLDQTSQVRSELLCILFIFVGLYFLTEFLKNKNKGINLFLFFIFFYLSVFMKTQIMFYVPFLIFLPIYTINPDQKFNLLNIKYKFLDKKIVLFSFYIFIFLLILIFANKNHASFLSKIFLLGFYLFFNLVFLLYLFLLKLKITKNLFFFNAILLTSTSVFFIIFLLHPSTEGVSQKLFNFMYIKVFSNIPKNVDDFTWISILINKFFVLIPESFNSIFFKINDYTILIYTLIFFTLMNLKHLDRKILFSILIIISYVLFSKIISNYRYDVTRYDIFFLPFLIYILVEVLSRSKKKITIYLVSITILFSTILINKNMIFKKQHLDEKINLFCTNVSNGYLDSWHRNLSYYKINQFCLNN